MLGRYKNNVNVCTVRVYELAVERYTTSPIIKSKIRKLSIGFWRFGQTKDQFIRPFFFSLFEFHICIANEKVLRENHLNWQSLQ